MTTDGNYLATNLAERLGLERDSSFDLLIGLTVGGLALSRRRRRAPVQPR
jgi:hypothetical protein